MENKTKEEKEEPKKDANAVKSKKESAGDEEEVEVPEKFKKLVGEIESLSVIDLSELVKVLEKKFGVSAAPQAVAVAAPSAADDGDGASHAQAKTIFNIELKSIGDKKIEVIKAVRDITGKGLKDSKDLVDAAISDSQVLKENVKKEEAEEIKKKLEAAGATVELK